MYETPKPSILNLFLTLVIFVTAAAYGMIALSTGDALWFWSKFNKQPSSITLQCSGTQKVVSQNSPHFAALTHLVNEGLSGDKNWDSLSMSQDTYEYFQTSDAVTVLEMHYAAPVRISSIYKYFSSVENLVIPLDGRHSQTNAVFGRSGENITAGSLHIANTQDIYEYVQAKNVCAID